MKVPFPPRLNEASSHVRSGQFRVYYTQQETGVILENEIRQLERSVNTLVCRPTLIRREYWAAQTERLLALPGLSARDRHRLAALLDLLGITTCERATRSGSSAHVHGEANCDVLRPDCTLA